MEMFFSTAGTTTTTTSPPPSPPLGGHSTDQIILLSGPPSCGKTSLLFQYAINSISQSLEHGDRRHVVFLCCRRRFNANPPFLSKGIDVPSSSSSCDVFNHIHIKYVEDEDDIKRYFAAFHLHEAVPIVVIVDDFGGFFDQRCGRLCSSGTFATVDTI